MMQSQQVNEIIIEQRRRQLDSIDPRVVEAFDEVRAHDGMRRTVASALVRIARTLDHDAVHDAGAREFVAR